MELKEFSEDDVVKACRTGDKKMLETISQSPNGKNLINFRENTFGWTMLYRYVMRNQHDMVISLLEVGADPNIQTKEGESPLHHACYNNQLKIAEILLNYKGNPQILNERGETPLHCACIRGHTAIVELLLRYHADPNFKNTLTGDTSLHVAYDWGRTDIIQILDLFGADFEIKNFEGKSSSDLALKQETKKIIEKFSSQLSSSCGSINNNQNEDNENWIFEDPNNKVSVIRMEIENDRLSDISKINPLIETLNITSDNMSEFNQEFNKSIHNYCSEDLFELSSIKIVQSYEGKIIN